MGDRRRTCAHPVDLHLSRRNRERDRKGVSGRARRSTAPGSRSRISPKCISAMRHRGTMAAASRRVSSKCCSNASISTFSPCIRPSLHSSAYGQARHPGKFEVEEIPPEEVAALLDAPARASRRPLRPRDVEAARLLCAGRPERCEPTCARHYSRAVHRRCFAARCCKETPSR